MIRRKIGPHLGSRALERMVAKEYENKGYSVRRAEYIGGAVAGKVFREKKKKSS